MNTANLGRFQLSFETQVLQRISKYFHEFSGLTAAASHLGDHFQVHNTGFIGWIFLVCIRAVFENVVP
jgi:hypothetical protein